MHIIVSAAATLKHLYRAHGDFMKKLQPSSSSMDDPDVPPSEEAVDTQGEDASGIDETEPSREAASSDHLNNLKGHLVLFYFKKTEGHQIAQTVADDIFADLKHSFNSSMGCFETMLKPISSEQRILDFYSGRSSTERSYDRGYNLSVESYLIPSSVRTNSCKRRYGITNEPLAAKRYEEVLRSMGHDVTITSCGLLVNPAFPWLGASPDRIVYDPEEASYGVVEIKCPYSLRETKGAELAGLSFYSKLSDSGPRLDRDNHYYSQVVGQMANHSTASANVMMTYWVWRDEQENGTGDGKPDAWTPLTHSKKMAPAKNARASEKELLTSLVRAKPSIWDQRSMNANLRSSA
ncbi:hypothetical protein HPB47_004040 [Ixodes persulcatus]|uniref:Uncharacterized protein n=1 Tax=Ixodes persulcatus TaxID=34615 RepID=A0AC60PGU9_IXOPE|nr:hypothetical protein HPB47_004040 [Ixodes persulcatus]